MTTESRSQSLSTFDRRLLCCFLSSGILLLLLLPAGVLAGTGSPVFTALFVLHLLTLLLSVAGAIRKVATFFTATDWIGISALIIGTGALALSLLEAWLPVTFRDSLIHHLAVPQWWIESGRIFSPAWHEWSFYPMLINLAYAGLISFGVETAAGAYNWLLSVLFCIVVAAGTERISESRRAAALAFMIAATVPIIHRLAPLPTADMGLALFSALAFFALLEQILRPAPGFGRAQEVSGIALGLALGCKYNALPFTLFALLLLLLFRARAGTSQALRAAFFTGIVALVVYSPWLARNYSLTSNPIFPLYSNIFKPSIERAEGIPSLKPLEQRHLIYQEREWQMLLLPLRIFIEGKDNVPAQFDGQLSPLLLIGFFGLLLLRKERSLQYSAALVGLVVVSSIFLNPLRVRYLAPVFAPLVFLTAMTLNRLLMRNQWLRGATLAALGAHVVLFSSYAGEKARAEQLTKWISGSISPDTYLNDRIPEYPLVSYINEHLSTQDRVYLLFTGNRFALYKPETFSGGHFSASLLVSWIRKSERTGKPLVQFFREYPATHILADSMRAQSFAAEQLSENEQKLWRAFVAEHLVFVHEDRGFSLWKVQAP